MKNIRHFTHDVLEIWYFLVIIIIQIWKGLWALHIWIKTIYSHPWRDAVPVKDYTMIARCYFECIWTFHQSHTFCVLCLDICVYLIIISVIYFVFPYVRPWFVFHQIPGWGQCGARSWSEDSGSAARWWELGFQRFVADVAMWKQPLPHHHRQIRPVPSLQLPGEPAGRHFPSWQTHSHVYTNDSMYSE